MEGVLEEVLDNLGLYSRMFFVPQTPFFFSSMDYVYMYVCMYVCMNLLRKEARATAKMTNEQPARY